MRRLDTSVNNLSIEELKELFFQGSYKPVVLKEGQFNKYQKLLNVLREFTIREHKICFISPPLLKPEALNRRTAKNLRYLDYPPHSFLYLSASIRSFIPGWKIKILDLNLEASKRVVLGQNHDYETLLSLIPNDFDIYGITWMFEANMLEAIRLMENLKDMRKFVVAGGVQSTIEFRNLLKNDLCTIVIKKEGEAPFVKLLTLWEKANDEHFKADGYSQEIYNLAFKYMNEIISFDTKFENPLSLDIRKEYSLIDLNEYNKYGSPDIWTRIAAKDKKWATLSVTRGCRGHCTYCQVSDIMGQGARTRSVSDVIDEILFLYHKKGVRHIEIFDDDFLGNYKRMLELLRRWADLKLNLTFSVGSGMLAISIDKDIVQAMSDAGCVMTGFGVETGNEKRLKSLRKPISLKKAREACEIFKKNHRHIWLQANFILGFPKETYGELMDTFNYAKSLEVDLCQTSILRPLGGTPIHEQLISLNDERVADSFGKDKMHADTPGRALVSRGLTFDDAYKEVCDFRNMELESIPNVVEIQQFQIYFNVFINLIGSVNLKSGGMPEKIKSFTDDVLKAYPMDAVSWGVNAKASKMLGLTDQYDRSMKNYEKALKNSTFWLAFFDLYEVRSKLGL